MNINLQPILDNLPVAQKDARRIGLFVAAVGAKSTQLATSDSAMLVVFLEEAASLVSRWIDKSRKFQFPIDFFRDPYKGLRDETRKFARDWSLDPLFISAMG